MSTMRHQEEEKAKSFKARIAPYVINPESKFKVAWDVMLSLVYMTCYLMDPYIYAHQFEPLQH